MIRLNWHRIQLNTKKQLEESLFARKENVKLSKFGLDKKKNTNLSIEQILDQWSRLVSIANVAEAWLYIGTFRNYVARKAKKS